MQFKQFADIIPDKPILKKARDSLIGISEGKRHITLDPMWKSFVGLDSKLSEKSPIFKHFKFKINNDWNENFILCGESRYKLINLFEEVKTARNNAAHTDVQCLEHACDCRNNVRKYLLAILRTAKN